MTDDRTQQQDRNHLYAPVQGPAGSVYTIGLEADNVQKAQRPTHLTPTSGGAGDETEWDASTLDKAIKWLDEHAEFLHQQSYKMEEDIQKWMKNSSAAVPGGVGEKSPLGSFQKANDLAAKHAALYTSTQTQLRQLARDLWKSANALREVKENYETAEARNRMNANQMQNAISGASDRAAKN